LVAEEEEGRDGSVFELSLCPNTEVKVVVVVKGW
jgi:hypothetical protein